MSKLPDVRTIVHQIEEGQIDIAIEGLLRLTEAFPFYVTPRMLLAMAYEKKGAIGDALAAWQEAHFLLPNARRPIRGIARAQRVLAEFAAPEDSDEPADTLASASELEGVVPVTPPPNADHPTEYEEAATPAVAVLDKELDDLIGGLRGARITPNTDTEDPDSENAAVLPVSETLAGIYERQGLFALAAETLRKLAAGRTDADRLLAWAREMEQKAAATND